MATYPNTTFNTAFTLPQYGCILWHFQNMCMICKSCLPFMLGVIRKWRRFFQLSPMWLCEIVDVWCATHILNDTTYCQGVWLRKQGRDGLWTGSRVLILLEQCSFFQEVFHAVFRSLERTEAQRVRHVQRMVTVPHCITNVFKYVIFVILFFF